MRPEQKLDRPTIPILEACSTKAPKSKSRKPRTPAPALAPALDPTALRSVVSEIIAKQSRLGYVADMATLTDILLRQRIPGALYVYLWQLPKYCLYYLLAYLARFTVGPSPLSVPPMYFSCRIARLQEIPVGRGCLKDQPKLKR